MVSRMRQMTTFVMCGMGLAGTLCAQRGITPGEALRLRQQCARELRGLQAEMAASQRENLHVVKTPEVALLEARKEQETRQAEKTSERKTNPNPRSPQQKAEVDEALKAFNARLPEVNAALAQTSSNSTLPKIVLTPMTAEGVLAASGGRGSSGGSAEQQAVNRMITQRIQEELKKADPETRNQMKAVLKAAEQGKPIPLPAHVPPPQHTQLLPKGSP